MPRVSTDELAARRQTILDGARRCFARHGYEGATVRRLEATTGLSRGAIFHHFGDKDALFLAVARQDADHIVDVVAEHGLVQVMRELLAAGHHEDAWGGTYLEVLRRSRTDPAFRDRWAEHTAALTTAVRARLERQARAGVLRADVDVSVLARFLELVLEGLVSRLAQDADPGDLDAVLDVAESAVRRR